MYWTLRGSFMRLQRRRKTHTTTAEQTTLQYCRTTTEHNEKIRPPVFSGLYLTCRCCYVVRSKTTVSAPDGLGDIYSHDGADIASHQWNTIKECGFSNSEKWLVAGHAPALLSEQQRGRVSTWLLAEGRNANEDESSFRAAWDRVPQPDLGSHPLSRLTTSVRVDLGGASCSARTPGRESDRARAAALLLPLLPILILLLAHTPLLPLRPVRVLHALESVGHLPEIPSHIRPDRWEVRALWFRQGLEALIRRRLRPGIASSLECKLLLLKRILLLLLDVLLDEDRVEPGPSWLMLHEVTRSGARRSWLLLKSLLLSWHPWGCKRCEVRTTRQSEHRGSLRRRGRWRSAGGLLLRGGLLLLDLPKVGDPLLLIPQGS